MTSNIFYFKVVDYFQYTTDFDYHILACSGRMKTTSGVLESSHCALSIGGSCKA